MLRTGTSIVRLLGGLSAVAAGCWASLALADATLVYEISDADGGKGQYTLTIVERFVRIDSDKEPGAYWLYDSGFRKLYRIDDDEKQYKLLRIFDNPYLEIAPAPSAAEPGDTPPKPEAKPKLIAGKEKKTVAGVQCRVITEKLGNEVVAQHCMAGTGPLGMSKREVYTLARLLTAPGQEQFGWLGAATTDERFASVQSRARDGKQGLELISISHHTVPDARVQIPKAYKNLDAPAPPPVKKVAPEKPEEANASE